VRVVRPGSEENEIMTIQAALQLAEGMSKDLVEVAPTAIPPVCRIMDFGKFMYEKKRKEKEAKKKQHVIVIKEMRFRPHTDDHDYDFKVRHARKFLQEGNKVKAVVQFRGRDIIYSDQGEVLLKRFIEDLSDVSKVEQAPILEGKRMNLMLTPDGKSKG
jgi:translation initiation factor IF-3